MSLQFRQFDMGWQPLPKPLEQRLEKILLSWKDTPYHAKVAIKKRGVDCVRFVCCVLDEFLGQPSVGLETLPADVAMHDKGRAFSVMRLIRRRYDPCDVVSDGMVQPCDIAVVGPPNGGPGHAMIFGTRKNTIWQSSAGSVHYQGMAMAEKQSKIFRIYRLRRIAEMVQQCS